MARHSCAYSSLLSASHCSSAPRRCFTGGTSPFFEAAGACTLYSTSDGWRPNLEQRGPQTKWISGHPASKTLPAIPDAQPGKW